MQNIVSDYFIPDDFFPDDFIPDVHFRENNVVLVV